MIEAVLEVGDLIAGRYRLVSRIGEGGMGVVFKAHNEDTTRDFALKVMLPEIANDPKQRARFLREARAAGTLRHQGIVAVYDVGSIDHGPLEGTPFIVMELLDGVTLRAFIDRASPISAGTALSMVRDVARAIHLAHERGIVHRDLKPENIFLARSSEDRTVTPKILDFGIAKQAGRPPEPTMTATGAVLGSAAYVSPEQAAGGSDIDRRSDVWTLGVLLHECLCGSLPFHGANFNAMLHAVLVEDPDPMLQGLAIPGAVSAIVDRCLRKTREARFQSAEELALTLDEVLAGQALPTLDVARVIDEALAAECVTGEETFADGPRRHTRSRALSTQTLPLPSEKERRPSGEPDDGAQSGGLVQAPKRRRVATTVALSLAAVAALSLVVTTLRVPASARANDAQATGPSSSSSSSTYAASAVASTATSAAPTVSSLDRDPVSSPATAPAPAPVGAAAGPARSNAASISSKPAAAGKPAADGSPKKATKPSTGALPPHEGIDDGGF